MLPLETRLPRGGRRYQRRPPPHNRLGVPAVLVATLFTSGLDQLNELLTVAQSIQLPFALLPLILLSSNTAVMGEYAIGRRTRIFVWTVFFVVLGINTFLAQKLAGRHMGTSALAIVCYVVVAALYFGFLAFVALRGRGESEAGANSKTGRGNCARATCAMLLPAASRKTKLIMSQGDA